MNGISNPYISIVRDGKLSYGGSQLYSDSEAIKKCGCGVVAAADTLLYISRFHCPCDCFPDAVALNTDSPVPLPEYNRLLTWLTPRYFQIIPPFGINGLMLVLGLNRLFSASKIPYRAIWAMSGEKLWVRIWEMLEADLPVILSVGPNFPLVWEKNRLNFYRKINEEKYTRAVSAKAHFVTVTGMDDKWLRISSWGEEYYIERGEYCAYALEHSTSILSNIVLIEKK